LELKANRLQTVLSWSNSFSDNQSYLALPLNLKVIVTRTCTSEVNMAQKNEVVRIESAEHFGSDMLIIELTDETVLQLSVQQIAALAAENKRPRRGIFHLLSLRSKASNSPTSPTYHA
jgi:hypothetical protein